MSVVTASLCFTLLFVFVFVSADQKLITAESGQDVTLTCRAPNKNITGVKWSRTDLGDEYVLLYQNSSVDSANQHPSYRNQADLQDRQMKDGDVSLILKDVMINDAGTYVCRVYGETNSWELISIIYLSIPPDQKLITAESGQDVILSCRAPNKNITGVKWSRADLEDKNVLLYQNSSVDSANQHPSFKNRVDLQDRRMKDGDVSLILKDVTINDAGTYECHIYMEETGSLGLNGIIILSVLPDQKIVTAESGQDITLTCRAPNYNVISVKWSKADLKSDYVLLYRNSQFVPANQHPSFKNRVDLQDRQMKDGDVSLILKDVTRKDAGTYVCRLYIRETHSLPFCCIITLSVSPGQPGRSVGLSVGLSVSAVLAFVVGFLIYRKHKKHQDQNQHSDEQPLSENFSPLSC